jgi:hypothetical protein
MKLLRFLPFLALLTSFSFAKNKVSQPSYLDVAPVINAINLVMIHDVISPPVAARYYAYSMLGAYKIISANDKKIPDPSVFIKKFPANSIATAKDYDYHIAALYCMLETSKTLLPSGYMLQDAEDAYVALLRKSKISDDKINKAISAAKKETTEVVDFSKSDNYNKLSAKLRYTPKKGYGYWYPTPPAYLDAVEPNWKTIRPLIIDSSSQFTPLPPTPFSKDSTSKFYILAKEVYDVSINLSQEQLNEASFWDCNPFAITTSGHMSIGYKKISPGGHWMNIAALVTKSAGLKFDQSVTVITMVSIGLMDAFIACWDEKYRSNRMRPETYINQNIDLKWKPLLQTPPFPEYTSGHAIISHTAAYLLSYLMGDLFAYTDNTEIPFGVGPRSFTSFKQAAAEASISRLYGGIHFRDSIEEGNKQGIAVANDIIVKLKKAGITQQR